MNAKTIDVAAGLSGALFLGAVFGAGIVVSGAVPREFLWLSAAEAALGLVLLAVVLVFEATHQEHVDNHEELRALGDAAELLARGAPREQLPTQVALVSVNVIDRLAALKASVTHIAIYSPQPVGAITAFARLDVDHRGMRVLAHRVELVSPIALAAINVSEPPRPIRYLTDKQTLAFAIRTARRLDRGKATK